MKNDKNEKKVNTGKPGISLSKRLWYVLVSMLFVVVVTFTLSLMFITNKAKFDYEIAQNETRINSVKSSINVDIQNYKDLSRLILLQDNVMVLLRTNYVDAGVKNDAHFSVMDVLNVCKNVDSVFVFRNDKQYMSTGKGVYLLDMDKMGTDEWKDRIYDKRGRAVFDLNGNSALYKKKGPNLLTLSRAIYDIDSQKLTGILLMNISLDMFSKIANDQGEGYICITDKEGKYLAGNKELVKYYCEDFNNETIVHKRIGDAWKTQTISGCAIEELPIVVICTSSEDTIKTMPKETVLAMVVLLLVFFIMATAVTIFMSRNVAKPIEALANAMEDTREYGHLKQIDIPMPNNEIAMLSDSYNNMIDHLNDLFEKNIEKEKAMQRAEMRVLYEQIKPHFLYNSLETISFLAMEAGADKVHDALETLGSFYRNFLSKGNRTISFKREIAIVKDYLSLQRLRYGDILNDEYDIEEEALEVHIPKLILQPLVENCIYHGIRPKGEEGIIRISGKMEQGYLHITVFDDGIGMSEDVIAGILDEEALNDNKTDDFAGSFGLRGTIERIRDYSGDKEAVKIESEIGEYTRIEIMIRGEQDV